MNAEKFNVGTPVLVVLLLALVIAGRLVYYVFQQQTRHLKEVRSKRAGHHRQLQRRSDHPGLAMVREAFFSGLQPDRLGARSARLFAQGNFPKAKKRTEHPKPHLLGIFDVNHAAEVQALIRSLEKSVSARCEGECWVEIVDVVEEPERAMQQQIFVTPMLVKELPEPVSRVLGDLNDARRVLMLPGLLAKEEERK